LAPALSDFLARYPEVELEFALTDRVVDLLAENADVAIRVGPVEDPSLVARKIGRSGEVCSPLRLSGAPWHAPYTRAAAGA